jgi:hypothetical protein
VNRRNVVVGVAAIVLFLVAVVGAMTFIDGTQSGNVHTMPDGRTMTGASHP